MLKDLLINPGLHNNRVIKAAAKKGRLEVVELLLGDPRVNPAANNNEVIKIAKRTYKDCRTNAEILSMCRR